MKKVCLCCERNRRIGKFGKMSRYTDGKNPYCRDCMRDKRKRYANSAKGRKKLEKAKKKWKKNNKKHIKEYNKNYYIENKDRIMFNLISRKTTESVLIFDNEEKSNNKKINKREELYIEINPKRASYGTCN